MKRFYAGAVAMLTAFTLSIGMAYAEPLNIAVGQAGRGYENFGKLLAERLGGPAEAVTVNYEGSDDISHAVCGNEAQVGIMQIDAIYARSLEGCNLRIVGSYGTEFAYLLVPEDSNLGDLGDFDANTTLLVDTIGSGTDLFWHTIVGIETGENGNSSTWSETNTVNEPIFIAQAMAEAGEIDAVLLVSKPESTDLAEFVAAGWELIELRDKDIDDQIYNNESLYPKDTAEIANTGGWLGGNTDANSYAIRSFVVINDETSRDREIFASVARGVTAIN